MQIVARAAAPVRSSMRARAMRWAPWRCRFFAIGSFAGAWASRWWTGLGTAPVGPRSADAYPAPYGGLSADARCCSLWFGSSPPSWRKTGASHATRAGSGFAAGFIALLADRQTSSFAVPAPGRGLRASACGRRRVRRPWRGLPAPPSWTAPANMERVSHDLLTRCHLANEYRHHRRGRCSSPRGGAASISRSRGCLAMAWVAAIVAGLLLGYSSRLAFGCNVGAFFSGHLDRQPCMAGSGSPRLPPVPLLGVKLRARLGFRKAHRSGEASHENHLEPRPVALASVFSC